MKTIIFYLINIFAGIGIAAGFVAFITLLGVFPAISTKNKLNKYYFSIERATILGATLGNIISIFQLHLPLGTFGVLFLTLSGGIFVGCMVASIAEILNLFPVISRRFNIRKQMPYLLYAIAFGKLCGSILQFIFFH